MFPQDLPATVSFPVRSNSTTYSLILPGKALHLIPSHTCPGWPPATRTGWRTCPWCPSQVGRGSRIFQPQFSFPVRSNSTIYSLILPGCCSCHIGQTVSRSGRGLRQAAPSSCQLVHQCGHNTLIPVHSGS